MAHRRIAVLSAHLRPTDTAPPSAPHRCSLPDGPPLVAPASCCSGSDRGAGRDSAAERDGEEGCVFCRIVRGESPAFKLYEDEVCICILDSNPLILGHSLIIPKSHSQSLDATPPSVVAAMCSTIPFLSNCIMKATQSDSFNLLVNNGSTAGQVIFHTHLHIIPRKAGDQLWPSENCKRKPIESNQKITDLVNSIRDLVSSSMQNNC